MAPSNSSRDAPAGTTQAGRSALDGWPARLVAVAVLVGAVALLAFYHREDLAPAAEAPPPEDAAFRHCLAKRQDDIEGMKADGLVDEARATLFTSRAEAYCRAQHPAP